MIDAQDDHFRQAILVEVRNSNVRALVVQRRPVGNWEEGERHMFSKSNPCFIAVRVERRRSRHIHLGLQLRYRAGTELPRAYLTKSLSAYLGLSLGFQVGSKLSMECLSPNMRPKNTSATIRPPTGPSCGVVIETGSLTGIFT